MEAATRTEMIAIIPTSSSAVGQEAESMRDRSER
jgi:hypothetical protein